MVELRSAEGFAHVNDPPWAIVEDQRATGQLVGGHELQTALAEHRGGHAGRAVGNSGVETRAQVELARQYVANFIP